MCWGSCSAWRFVMWHQPVLLQRMVLSQTTRHKGERENDRESRKRKRDVFLRYSQYYYSLSFCWAFTKHYNYTVVWHVIIHIEFGYWLSCVSTFVRLIELLSSHIFEAEWSHFYDKEFCLKPNNVENNKNNKCIQGYGLTESEGNQLNN